MLFFLSGLVASQTHTWPRQEYREKGAVAGAQRPLNTRATGAQSVAESRIRARLAMLGAARGAADERAACPLVRTAAASVSYVAAKQTCSFLG
jgi:hypothetical protein